MNIPPPVFPVVQDKMPPPSDEIPAAEVDADSPLTAPPVTTTPERGDELNDTVELISHRVTVHWKSKSELTVLYFLSEVNARATYEAFEEMLDSYVKAVEYVTEESTLKLIAGKNKVPDSEFWPR